MNGKALYQGERREEREEKPLEPGDMIAGHCTQIDAVTAAFATCVVEQ